MSRRRAAAVLVTIRWRDIPAQVLARDGVETEKALLPSRFQHAIDRAARVAGLTERTAYVAQWRRDEHPLEGPPAAAVAARVQELERAYPRARLAVLVQQGGLAAAEESA